MQQNKQFMESGSIMAVHIILYILVLKIYIFSLTCECVFIWRSEALILSIGLVLVNLLLIPLFCKVFYFSI